MIQIFQRDKGWAIIYGINPGETIVLSDPEMLELSSKVLELVAGQLKIFGTFGELQKAIADHKKSNF